jgi:glycosyltransferase involved in cell wall biosynthesis
MLKRDLESRGTDLRVFCGMVEGQRRPVDDTFLQRLAHLKFNIKIGGLQEKLVLLLPLFSSLAKYRPDIIISEDISAMPNCLAVQMYARLFGIPYVIHGPGAIPNKKPSKLKYLLWPLIDCYRKGANAFLCYSSYAERYYYDKYHKPCYLAYNSVGNAHSETEYERIRANIYRKYAAPMESGVNVVFVGRLTPQKRVDLLLAAISQTRGDARIAVRIIGDGNSKEELIALSKRLGTEDRISFLGSIWDDDKKAALFMDAHLGVLPGLGGLAIQEMMWYGIPVITSSADGTEGDLVVQGGGGLYIAEMNADSLQKSIASFVSMQYEEKVAMALSALDVVHEKYNLSSMVAAYRESVTQQAGRPPRSR